jgi:hypothetical protein
MLKMHMRITQRFNRECKYGTRNESASKNKLAAATAAAAVAAPTVAATATAAELVVTAAIAPARNTRGQYLGG